MEYPIQRWSGVILGANTEKNPMIYIKPDINFINLIKRNSYIVKCSIHNTKSNYDNQTYLGVVNKSCDNSVCKSNYYDKVSDYTITIDSKWQGQPNNVGIVKFDV